MSLILGHLLTNIVGLLKEVCSGRTATSSHCKKLGDIAAAWVLRGGYCCLNWVKVDVVTASILTCFNLDFPVLSVPTYRIKTFDVAFMFYNSLYLRT